MKRIAIIAALLAIAAPSSRALAGEGGGKAPRDGEVRAVSVMPAAGGGRVEVVIDLQGAVEVHDFTLANPARLVVDLTGAKLTAPAVLYDGQNRGGIKNIRFGQFKPGVVRVVLELDRLADYEVQRGDATVRVRIGTERTAFDAWSSKTRAPLTVVAAPAAAAATRTATPATAARTETPRQPDVSGDPGVRAYLERHRADAAQSQAPRITVTWDGATIEEVVAGFAAFSGRTIIVSKNVTGSVSAEVKNQPWDLAFAAVLESQGLASQSMNGVLIVSNKKDLAAADSTVPLETRLVRVNYARAQSLVPAVQSIVSKPRGAVVADSGSNALVITDVQTRINEVENFVRGLDIRTPQVSIQAKIILVNRTDIEELGVKYDLGSQTQFFNQLIQRPDPRTAQPVDTDLDGVPDALVPTENFDPDDVIVDLGGNSLSALGNAGSQVVNPALQMIFSTAIGNFDLSAFLVAIQRVELGDVEAVPSITTLDNRTAEILVGDRVPIRVIDASAGVGANAQTAPTATVQFEQTGIKLRVTPHVTANRQILLEVHAERSSVQPAPVDIGFTFQTQQADNQLLVDDGQTAVVGGLTVTEVTATKSGIPFLVDLPIIGKLFGFSTRQENRRDLLILITPHIVDDLVTPDQAR